MRGTRLRVQQKRVPLETLSNLDSRPTNPILLEFYSRIIKSNLGEKRKEEEKTERKKEEEKNEKKKKKKETKPPKIYEKLQYLFLFFFEEERTYFLRLATKEHYRFDYAFLRERRERKKKKIRHQIFLVSTVIVVIEIPINDHKTMTEDPLFPSSRWQEEKQGERKEENENNNNNNSNKKK